MNLRTASLLCDRFLSCVGDGGLVDQLGDVLAKGSAVKDSVVDSGEAPQDAIDELSSAAEKALASYDDSLFVDPAMKIFPEFSQLGFAGIMGRDFEKCLKSMCTADGHGDDFAANLAQIGREGEGIRELTDQIERLMAVANYFGVESRDDFEADAIAVIQMPEGEAGEHAGGNVDAFVERMQSFQSIVEFCGVSDESGANIRMIAGDDALVVADLSSDGARKLQNMISDVKSAKSDIVEIENASERLKNVGVSDKIIDMLGEETGLIRGFDESKAGGFITSLLNGENSVTSKWMANAVMGLLDSGVRIDSVALKPHADDETAAVVDDEATDVAKEMTVVAEALEALDDEAAAGDDAPSSDTSSSETSHQAEEADDDASSSVLIAGATALAGAGSLAAKNTADNAAQAVDNVVEMAGDVSDEAASLVSEGAEGAASVVDEVKQEASDLADAASEKASDMANGACDLANDASEKAQGVVEGAVETASDAVSNTVEQAETVVEEAKEAVSNGISNGIDKVSDTVSDTVDDVLKGAETKSEAEVNAARARKKSLRSIWETFSGRS